VDEERREGRVELEFTCDKWRTHVSNTLFSIGMQGMNMRRSSGCGGLRGVSEANVASLRHTDGASQIKLSRVP